MGVPKLHKHEAESRGVKVFFAVITVSTSRFKKHIQGLEVSDESGDVAIEMISNAGFKVVYRELIADNKQQILESLSTAIKKKCNVIIYIGGTGLTKSDITVDVLKGVFEKEIVGFGELFRYLSYIEVGSPAMLSRATAGIYKNAVIFALPGSKNAVRLALEKLILPEIGHIIYLINK